jgi:predicted RNase H-like nuclease
VTTNRVAGIDGCRGGWVCVIRDGDRWEWTTSEVDGIGALIEDDATTGIDIPIGLLATGERPCDGLARAGLPGAASRVFATPPRGVLELGWQVTNAVAQEMSRRLMGKGVSRQALALGPRVLAVDEVVRLRPGLQVIEVHPELSFAAMSHGPPLPSKKTIEGARARVDALRQIYDEIDEILSRAPARVPMDDCLDALAVLWTAERWRDGVARTLPDEARERPFIAT